MIFKTFSYSIHVLFVFKDIFCRHLFVIGFTTENTLSPFRLAVHVIPSESREENDLFLYCKFLLEEEFQFAKRK